MKWSRDYAVTSTNPLLKPECVLESRWGTDYCGQALDGSLRSRKLKKSRFSHFSENLASLGPFFRFKTLKLVLDPNE